MLGRSPALTPPALLLAFLLAPQAVQAHALEAEYRVLPDHKVQISSWYNTTRGDQPARGARVRIFRAHRDPLEGKTDADGTFEFSYDQVEPLKIEVYQTGHRAELTIPAAALGKVAESTSPIPSEPSVEAAPIAGSSVDHNRTREGIKDILVGVGFLLAVAAFVLSLWNSQRLRQLEQRNSSAREELH